MAPKLQSNVVPLAQQPPAYSFGRMLKDSFTNLLSGIGVLGRDKQASMQYAFQALTPEQLEFAYRGHWLPRKIINIPAQDMTRNWRTWQGEEDEVEKIVEFEKQFGIQRKVMMAMVKARLYGGAAILIGTDDGKFDEELDLKNVKKDSVKFVHVLSRWDVSAGRIVRDITSPYYSEPEYYQRSNPYDVYGTLTGTGSGLTQQRNYQSVSKQLLNIHPSRVIRFLGNEYPDLDRAPDSWGDSILQTVDDAIKSAGTVSGSLATMINEAKLDIINVPGLTEILSTQAGTDKLVNRFAAANVHKSVINGLILDKEEAWQRVQLHFEGMPAVLQAFLLLASGAADIPATRLYGREPAGQNSTGESDMRNYYDRLASDQTTDLQPRLVRLDEVMLRSVFGSRPANIDYTWGSLWQMPENEKADRNLKKAQSYQIDVNAGLIPDEVLREGRQNQLIADDVYPGLDTALADYEAGLLEPIDFPTGTPAGADLAAANENQRVLSGGLQEEGDDDAPAKKKATGDRRYIVDATPRPLYVRRELLNRADIKKWAKSQGFKTVSKDMHVTLLYSKTPVDPMAMGRTYDSGDAVVVPAGGPRAIEQFNDNAVVLQFAHAPFDRRHDQMVEAGASHGFPEFQCHVTITYSPGDVALDAIEPYSGQLIFGPEIFAPITKVKPRRFLEDAFNPEQERDDHGRWGSGGGGSSAPAGGAGPGGASSSVSPANARAWATNCKNFMNNKETRKVVAHSAKQFVLHHAAGLMHHNTMLKILEPAISAAILTGLTQLGLGPVATFAAEAVASYAIVQLAHKSGFTPDNAHKALSYVGHALLSAKHAISGSMAAHKGNIGEVAALGGIGDAVDPDDPFEVLARFVAALDNNTTDELMDRSDEDVW